MQKLFWLVLVLALAIGGATIAACGDDDTADGGTAVDTGAKTDAGDAGAKDVGTATDAAALQ